MSQPENSAVRETAGSHMVTSIPRATPQTRVSEVIAQLRGRKYECADTIFVVDDTEHLLGVVRINDLLADGEHCLGDIMEEEHQAVRTDDDQEQIAMLAIDLNMIVVPVVDASEKLIGAVPPEALFRILRDEHMEDLQRLAGIALHAEGPEVALNAPLSDRFLRRLPWLVFGLVASSLITFVMARFEETLSANVAVAFFVPALVYIAGAIGTQAVSVAVRGLVDEDLRIARLLRDELLIGIAIGTTLGVISAAAVHLTFGDHVLALAVGLAVLGGGAVSAVVGFGLPWLFRQFGFDPALGSGPICTIIQDVSSLFIYFVLVTLLVV
ncbi:MAG: magnesium transporter [Gammaproteobacteria bacterium]|nr:magnesium transporter [Gammaproteobacteria bacterium]